MKKIHKKLSAVVVCYNDEGNVQALYDRLSRVLQEATDDYEIIYVNDASPDDAYGVLKGIAKRDSHVTVITHSINSGTSNAYSSGMMQSLGDAVILLDGDLQDPPELIPKLLEQWQSGYEIVYGVRTKREGSFSVNVLPKFFYRVFRYLSYAKIPLDAGDFSLMDRKVVDAINAMPERHRIIRGLRALVGFRHTGIEYVRPERYSGTSTYNLKSYMRWARKTIFSFSYAPLEVFFYISLFSFLLSSLLMIVYAIRLITGDGAFLSFQTVLVFLFFFGSVQLLSISVIGEYIGIIFDETKQRSRFIVKEILNDHRQSTSPSGLIARKEQAE
ncbi:MAG: glycosyltransferase family 2 protein [Patescibacteria group bacterium]